MSILEAQKVNEIFVKCLFEDGEDTTDHVKAEGITLSIGFHPKRLEENRKKVGELLMESNPTFLKSGGGGWSFLNFCMDKNDRLWTGEHRTMQELMLMGIALGYINVLMPRPLWPNLPGGMPYFAILDDKILEDAAK